MSSDSNIASYTAANAFPVKVLKSRQIIDDLGRIKAVHVQLNPTNRCNLNCDFCSCAKRDRHMELDFDDARAIMRYAKTAGCRAVTITGGGEPLLYPKINELIKYLHDDLNIQIGLVTNGTQLEKLAPVSCEKIKWIRISHSDSRPFDKEYRRFLSVYVFSPEPVDWAFSYVLSEQPNYENIANLVSFANATKFTHVRIVSDLLDIEHVPNMGAVKGYLRRAGISDRLVIYQGRKEFTRGRRKCLISLLKPLISADGKLYPCCVHENETIPVVSNGFIMNKSASEVEVGDFAITPDGSFAIRETFESKKRKSVKITLKNGRSLICSLDHLLFIADKIEIQHPYPRLKKLKSYDLKEVRADQIKIGDMIPVLYRLPKIEHGAEDISPEMARILGYYTGDGWSSGTGVGFMFGKKKKSNLDDLFFCLKHEGFRYTVYERRTGIQIMAKVDLNKRLKSLEAGTRALNKRVPYIIFNADDAIKKEYLKGYLRTDGHIRLPEKNFPGIRATTSTVSMHLAADLVLLLNSVGIEPTIHLEKRNGKKHIIEGRTVNVHDRYHIKISGHYNLKKIKECLGVKYTKGSKTSRMALTNPRNQTMMFLPVKKIETIEGGIFYDFKVDGAKFCAGVGSIMVHNCGAQYAKENPPLDYDESMSMGDASELIYTYLRQLYFDGSQCVRCYYDNYNVLLDQMTMKLEHEEFV